MKKPGTIFHVEFMAGGHHYFGSIAAIYDHFSTITLGVSQHRLYDFIIGEDKPYSNKFCIIRKGKLLRKHGNRKLPTREM